MKTIVVVGGGAAGMMAAYYAKNGAGAARVILLEKNSYLGAKVIISGGGRCNVTTGVLDVKKVLENYPRGAEFIRTAMQKFPPKAVMEWFESQGVALKIEDDLRVFPVSDNGKDIVGALEKALKNAGVEIKYNAQVVAVEDKGEEMEISFKAGGKLKADSLIITTGGNAYRHTGSTGDGYALSQALGHSITELAPSLASLKLAEMFYPELAGLSFEKIGFTFISSDGLRKFSRQGPAVFTHSGVSGPAVFALLGLAAFEGFSAQDSATLSVDFCVEYSRAELEKKLIEDFETHKSKLLKNVLGFYLPARLVELWINEKVLVDEVRAIEKINCSEVSKKLRTLILDRLKGWQLKIIGRGAGDEFVTAGGVSLKEVNPKTMESLIRPGLFFAGEILDVDGFTGGYNLQASWACGALAGESAAKN